MQSVEFSRNKLVKTHNKSCEFFAAFSPLKFRKNTVEKSKNINYKQNMSKKILCKNITLKKTETIKTLKFQSKNNVLNV